MTQATHTPGPWRRQVIAPTFEHTAIQTADGKRSIARAYKKGDARLIAAAPDLLEAASLAVAAYREGDDDDMDAAIADLNAAIAKAKGTTS